MSLKSQILKVLESNSEEYKSGGALAEELSVSRNAVWKAVEALRTDGYGITAVTNKGYKIETIGDVLSAAGIERWLTNEKTFKVEVRRTVTSTNEILRGMAAEGVAEGYIIAAEEQTAGKGRFGRSFYSPRRSGVYFSILLRPEVRAETAALITSAAAVATAQAIEDVTGVYVGIKWVNDLFTDGKKVCGILTEASFDMESGLIGNAVLGIGINIVSPEGGFPVGISNIAAALTKEKSGYEIRNRLVAQSVNNFWRYYCKLEAKDFLEEYRRRSIILGSDIKVLSGGTERSAKALAIDDECGLRVRYDDGSESTLSSGEVSIKKDA